MREGTFWNEKAENITGDRLTALRLEKLRKQLDYCSNNPFYEKKFREVGLEPGDIKTWEDFRRIPVRNN